MEKVTFATKYENFMQKAADKLEAMWDDWEKDATTIKDILKKHKTALALVTIPIATFLAIEWCLVLWIVNMG